MNTEQPEDYNARGDGNAAGGYPLPPSGASLGAPAPLGRSATLSNGGVAEAPAYGGHHSSTEHAPDAVKTSNITNGPQDASLDSSLNLGSVGNGAPNGSGADADALNASPIGPARFEIPWDRTYKSADSVGQKRTTTSSGNSTRVKPIPRPSPTASERLRPLPLADVGQFASKLQSEHLLVVSCEDDFTLVSAFFAMYEDERFRHCGTAHEILEFELEAILEQELSDNKPDQMLVINAGGEQKVEARGYLLHLWDALNKTHIQRTLAEARKNLVILAAPSLFGGPSELVRRLEGVPHWPIPPITPLLQNWFPTGHSEILLLIKAQQQKGRWPTNERLLLERIKQYGDPERLRAALQIDETHRVAPPVSPSTTLSTLTKTVLYVATFFPALHAEEFEFVLLQLLGDEAEGPQELPSPPADEGEDEVQTAEGQTAKGQDGQPTPKRAADPGPSAVKPQQPPLLRDVWTRDYVSIMRACKLEFRRQGDTTISAEQPQEVGRRVVFNDPDLLAASRELFEGTLLLDHLRFAKKVRELGLLFRAGHEITRAVIRLVVDLAVMRPATYGRSWLLELIAVAGPDKLVDADGLGLPEQLLAMVINSKHGQVRSAFYQVLYQLLSEMLKHDPLHAMVKSLLDDLMKSREGQEAVLEIARRLRAAPELNAFYWLKRLLDEGKEPETKLKAKFIVLSSARSFHMLYVLQKVSEWLPPTPLPTRLLEQLAPSVYVAADLMVDLTLLSILQPDRGTVGQWPPNNRFFSRLSSSGDERPLAMIVGWLFRPETERCLATRDTSAVGGLLTRWLAPPELCVHLDDNGKKLVEQMRERWNQTAQRQRERFPSDFPGQPRQLFHALLLAEWAVILQGTEETPHPEGEAYLRLILRQVVAVTDDRQQRRMLSFWTALEESLLETLGALGDSEQAFGREQRDARRTLRRQLRGMRRRVRELVSLFSETRREKQPSITTGD